LKRLRGIVRRALRPTLPAGALVLAGTVTLALTGAFDGSGAIPRAVAGSSPGEPTAQTDDSLPAANVILFGSSPGEAAGETWGVGEVGMLQSGKWGIVQYTSAGGWSLAPGPFDSAGNQLSGFLPDQTPLTGEASAAGDGVLVGTVNSHEVLLVRNPGESFKEAPPVPSEGEGALIHSNESLFSASRTPLIAALDEGGHAGVLVVPVDREATADETGVLHWDGKSWTREPIEVPKEGEKEPGGFRVLAIAASSPGNAWLLAQLSGASQEVALFHRQKSRWIPVSPSGKPSPGAPFALRVKVSGAGEGPLLTVNGVGDPPNSHAQLLTVSGEQGVWIDGERTDAHVPVTIFFKPEHPAGESGETVEGGEVIASWCSVPGAEPPCSHMLPEEGLPKGPSRSFAWEDTSSSTPFGERVITGLLEGVSLRLEGESFKRVLSLGGSEAPNDVGGSHGAAFSSAREGWLGDETLPVHLTESPIASGILNYPVPFRRPLTAIAPQPGAPVGALSSEALAVGDQGEVARYLPGEGWQPESLFGLGGRIERPRLRAVAWPTPQRAYAVGDEGQMWLWRAETGLWEPDPATPINFRGNLLGIAFDPSDPSIGYAVGQPEKLGQTGALLRYGKTWSQETSLPSEVAGASFTSIAFAGSEAIVAYRVFHPEANGELEHYTGGLLVNEGSGWHVDQGAAQVIGKALPWAVAGLEDGAAAVSSGGNGEPGEVFERDSSGGSWQTTPAYPAGVPAPGSLALFEEGGALRAVAAGAVLQTKASERQKPLPAGFPPQFFQPYPLTESMGPVLRQTGSGWSDQQHEFNGAQEPNGEYKEYDQVYNPDPIAAVLIDSSGGEGWAVGGQVDNQTTTLPNGGLDTADVARYPAESGSPPGVAKAPVKASSGAATFAIGGDSACHAPCADRADAGVGPDTWLASALEQARAVQSMRAFLYTGPRVTTGEGHGQFPVPWTREFARYAELLADPSREEAPALAVPSPNDLRSGSECPFAEAFAAFPYPFGDHEGSTLANLLSTGRSSEACSTYYAFESKGDNGEAPVRVIMLDEAGGVGTTELEWLKQQLSGAQSAPEPAIVVGNADLNAQVAAGDATAAAVAEAIIAGHASAYFYDAPEQNVTRPLLGSSVPTFGSGTLGYVSLVSAEQADFIGDPGFLLAQIEAAPTAQNAATKQWPVKVQLIPNVGELALEAKDGVLLPRSKVALFEGLARRPRSGGEANAGSSKNESDVYIPLPSNCIGSQCLNRIAPAYSFHSSNPDIGDFVEPNTAAAEPATTVLLGPDEKPIHDEESGLFCAYNAGTTTVTISAGGLSYSLNVTVQAGSVRRPCGTVPLQNPPAQQQQISAPPPPPAPAPAPTPAPAVTPTPLLFPAPPAPPAPPAAPRPTPPPPPPPFFAPAALAAPPLPFVPPPVPTPARPTPPTGTSAVTSPIEVAEKEEEQEEAPESVTNKALAYRAPEHEPAPEYLLGLILLAALAGASLRGRPRRDGREVRVAPATITTMRAQRRMSSRRQRLP